MTAKTRIYLVVMDSLPYLVRAANKVQAVRHVADRLITASLATQDQLIAALGDGIAVETASEPSSEEAAP